MKCMFPGCDHAVSALSPNPESYRAVDLANQDFGTLRLRNSHHTKKHKDWVPRYNAKCVCGIFGTQDEISRHVSQFAKKEADSKHMRIDIDLPDEFYCNAPQQFAQMRLPQNPAPKKRKRKADDAEVTRLNQKLRGMEDELRTAKQEIHRLQGENSVLRDWLRQGV